MLPLHGLMKWKMSSHKARLPPGAALSLLVLQRLDSQLWRAELSLEVPGEGKPVYFHSAHNGSVVSVGTPLGV